VVRLFLGLTSRWEREHAESTQGNSSVRCLLDQRAKDIPLLRIFFYFLLDAALLYGSGERVLALTVAEAGTSMLSQQDDVV
jgi:hypothetical protein